MIGFYRLSTPGSMAHICGGVHWGIHRHKVIGIYVLMYTVTPTSRAILTARNILWIVTSKKYGQKWIIVEKWHIKRDWHWNFYPSVISEIKVSGKTLWLWAIPFNVQPPSPPPMDGFFWRVTTFEVKPVGILWSLQFFWGVVGKIYKFLRFFFS
jgi:hypothetical protein